MRAGCRSCTHKRSQTLTYPTHSRRVRKFRLDIMVQWWNGIVAENNVPVVLHLVSLFQYTLNQDLDLHQAGYKAETDPQKYPT